MSASRIATRETSGRSSPSRSRLIPTRTSNSPRRSERRISMRWIVSMSLCRYWTRYAGLGEELGEVLGHLLGERRDQGPLAAGHDLVEARAQVVDLVLGRHDRDLRVDEAGRADHLLGDLVGDLELVGPRGRRDEDHLGDEVDELLEVEGPVVERAGQAEAVLDQDLLARPVPGVLAAQLGHRDVALVDDHEEVAREVVEQGVGPLPGERPSRCARVVLDPRADPRLLEHLEVVLGARAQPLGLEELALALEARPAARRARPRSSATARAPGSRRRSRSAMAAKRVNSLTRARTSWVSGLKKAISSSSSPKNETRTASWL